MSEFCLQCERIPGKRCYGGLCRGCYDTGTTQYGRRFPPMDDPEVGPTSFLPGTMGKIRVMNRRYLQGWHIYHPLDATWDDVVNEIGSRVEVG